MSSDLETLMSNPDDPNISGPVGENRVAIDYIKSNLFRAIRTDGVIGSVTPTGHIHMAFYSERPAIPRRQVYSLSSKGTLGEAIPEETVSRNSIVRELDADVFLTLNVAEVVHKWLGDRIADVKNWEVQSVAALSDEEK
ncbi:MAG: hypothetical protein K8S25_14335 [Alphaproteobacteria bacterium]|nr:hypothetical protein [Alphaproteobacteria bacterium]